VRGSASEPVASVGSRVVIVVVEVAAGSATSEYSCSRRSYAVAAQVARDAAVAVP
jgi:hypothetical protein